MCLEAPTSKRTPFPRLLPNPLSPPRPPPPPPPPSLPPPRTAVQGERLIRGSGLYHTASFLNHDCMPNVARFDNFDAPEGVDNTCIEFRALHDIPAGEQITQSYFPLTWSYEERQQRCQQQYGFTCNCSRCQVTCHLIVYNPHCSTCLCCEVTCGITNICCCTCISRSASQLSFSTCIAAVYVILHGVCFMAR